MLAQCEKCGCELEYWHERTGVTRFIGGIFAKLCNPCNSEMTRLIESHELFDEHCKEQAKLAYLYEAAKNGQDVEARIVVVNANLLAIQRAFWPIVRAMIPVREKVKAESD